MSKIFLLGVGAQKAGTTWLHSELSRTRWFEPGFSKEYHIFDVLFLPELKCMKNKIHEKLRYELDAGRFASNGQSKFTNSLKLSFYDSLENYFNYFDYLFLKDSATQIVGDFTPSYSMLPMKTFRLIKESLESRGFQVKIIFGMRDPFNRIYSQLRMSIRNQKRKGNHLLPDSSIDQLLLSYYQKKGVELRTRYDLTIQALEAIFPQEDIYYFFYENLFCSDCSSDIARFLAVPNFNPNFSLRKNSSPYPKVDLQMNTIKQVVDYYYHVYTFIAEKFGADAIIKWSVLP